MPIGQRPRPAAAAAIAALGLLVTTCACDDAVRLPPPATRPSTTADGAEPAGRSAPATATAPPIEPPASATVIARRAAQLPSEEDSAAAQGVKVVTARSGDPVEDAAQEGRPPRPEDRWMKCEQFDVNYLGKNLRTLRIGPPTGRGVLLLHGARFNSRTWLELGTLDLLAKNGYRAMAIDLPGYGHSKEVKARAEEFLYLALPFLDLPKPVVVFPSMSGTFAFPLAAAHPEMISGLVPVAPVGVLDLAQKLKGSQLPARIFWGERDAVIPVTQAEVLAQLLPNSQKTILAGADHACYQDRPEEFHKALLEFLASLKSDDAGANPPKKSGP